MLNRIILVGRLVQDPELRKSNSDTSIANFTIAVDNSMKEADGTRGTCFLDCKVFGDKADNLVKYVSKGDRVAIDGSINQRNFIRQDGSKGKAIEVLVDSVEFIEPKPKSNPDDYDGPYDSCGSLDGEEYEDENGEVKKLRAIPPEPKFDPMTGKPLKERA